MSLTFWVLENNWNREHQIPKGPSAGVSNLSEYKDLPRPTWWYNTFNYQWLRKHIHTIWDLPYNKSGESLTPKVYRQLVEKHQSILYIGLNKHNIGRMISFVEA